MDARPVVVALVVLLAGCPAIGGDSVETVTPAPVPESTVTTPGLPPGLAGDGVTDVNALLAAHIDALDATSYVWAARERRRFGPNSSVLAFERRIAVEDDRRYYWTLDRRPLFVRWGSADRTFQGEAYADGQTRWGYRVVPGGRDYNVDPATDASGQLSRISARPVGMYLDAPNATVVAVRRDGERRFRVFVDRSVYEFPLPGVSPVYNYTASATVRPSGLVTSLDVSYDTERGPYGAEVVYNYTITGIGTTTVTPPAWVADARANTTETPPVNPSVAGPGVAPR